MKKTGFLSTILLGLASFGFGVSADAASKATPSGSGLVKDVETGTVTIVKGAADMAGDVVGGAAKGAGVAVKGAGDAVKDTGNAIANHAVKAKKVKKAKHVKHAKHSKHAKKVKQATVKPAAQ